MIFHSPWVVFALALIVVGGVFALYKWFKVFNSPDGERYMKMRMQGSFTPTPTDDSKAAK